MEKTSFLGSHASTRENKLPVHLELDAIPESHQFSLILCSVTGLDGDEDGFIVTDEISARALSEFRQQMVLQGAFPKNAVCISKQRCVRGSVCAHTYVHTSLI